MKAVYLTLFSLALTLLTPLSHAEDRPLLIDNPPEQCQLNADSPDLAADLAVCIRQAELGHAYAQFILGNYWHDGHLTAPDFAQALHWYEQASTQGHADAQHQLGLMFAHGEGVPINRSQAYVILKMSAVNGSDTAFDAVDRLTETMSAQELKQAERVLSHIFRRYLKHIQAQALQDGFDSEPLR